jgi:hypothetical protein
MDHKLKKIVRGVLRESLTESEPLWYRLPNNLINELGIELYNPDDEAYVVEIHFDTKNVLIFDDCDSVFTDDLSLNILKAALDSGKTRRICWNSDSRLLREEGIPNTFNFNGSAIFITNLKFGNLKSKKLQDHLEALQSRCHFLDLTIDGDRDKMLRIKQVHRDADGGLFKDYDFNEEQSQTVINFMWDNHTKLREVSLRMCLKIADLVKISPGNWQNLAKTTCMKA